MVNGFLFRSEELVQHWQRLDDFEGNGYRRIIVNAEDEQGQKSLAYVYALNNTNN